jgi:MFS family permease
MPRQQILNLLAAIAAVTVFGFTLGLMFPLLSLIMEQNGLSADVIGLNTAMQPLGIVLSVFTIPLAVHHFGAKRTAIIAALLTAAVILAYPFAPIYWWWFGLRILHGFFVSTLFAVSEAWIVRFAEGPWRSRLLALYTSVLALSFGGGPALISFTGIDGALPFVIGAIVLAVATLPMLLVKDADVSGEDESPPSVLRFIAKAPVLVASVFAFAIIDAAFLGFLPVYGVKKGMGAELAAFALTVFIIGNTVLQFPIGWLADHFNKRAVLTVCVLLAGLTAGLLPWLFGTWMMWPLLALCGASSAAIYTIALSALGDSFAGPDLTAGTASFSMTWGAGALFGALAAGRAFELYGPDGMPWLLAILLLAFGVGLTMTIPKHLRPQARS